MLKLNIESWLMGALNHIWISWYFESLSDREFNNLLFSKLILSTNHHGEKKFKLLVLLHLLQYFLRENCSSYFKSVKKVDSVWTAQFCTNYSFSCIFFRKNNTFYVKIVHRTSKAWKKSTLFERLNFVQIARSLASFLEKTILFTWKLFILLQKCEKSRLCLNGSILYKLLVLLHLF